MEETVAVDRVTALYLAVMELHAVVIPKLHTVDGLACLTHLVYTLAGDDNADPDCRRAARMIVAHSSGDVDGFNAVIDEVADSHRGSELLIGMFAVFSAFVPVLYGEARPGRSATQRAPLGGRGGIRARDLGPAPGIRSRVPFAARGSRVV